MSSKINHALFELIKSLTKSEKRYFKLMSSRHTIGNENNYIRLFDYLEQLESYDEKQIFQHFKGEAFLNRFSITKKRLYDHIMSALDTYYMSSSTEAQLFKMLHSSDILFEKSLYDQSKRMLRSAYKLAAKHELSEILLQIEGKQKKLIETAGYAIYNENEVLNSSIQVDNQLNMISSFNKLWLIKSKLFHVLSTKGVARSEQDVEYYDEVCAGLEKISELPLSSEAKYLYHHTLSAYHFAKGELTKSLIELKNNLELLEIPEVLQKIEVNKHVSLLTNAIYISDKIGATKESMIYLSKLKVLANSVPSNDDISIKLFSSISSIELSMLLRKGAFNKAVEYGEEVSSKLSEFKGKLTPSRCAFLSFKLAVAEMGIGNYSEALKWINTILNDPNLDKTEDIVGFTQLLDLLVHIELNHVQLLPYSLKSVHRYFKSRNRMHAFERVFLQFIGKIIKSEDRFEAETIWGNLYNELSKITNDDAFESVALDYFDFQSWAKAKLTNTSFDRIVREKYQERLQRAS